MNYILSKKPTIQDQGLTLYSYYISEIDPITKKKGDVHGPFDTVEEINTYCKEKSIPFTVDTTLAVKA